MKRFALFLLLAAAASAEHYDPSLFSALQWRSVGPNRGGRSITSAGSATRPYEYYFGAVGGGLWKTVDGGTTWKPVTDGQIKSSSVGAVAVSESNPDVVYIGMGETELRGNIMQGDGVYKSADAGKTWTHMGLSDTQAISRIRVDPTNADIVYVAALGHPYGPNAERGIFRSKDGGKTWQKILYKDDHAGAVDLSLDPHNPRVMYAAIWDVYRTSWTLSSGGPRSGFYKSTDGGDHWSEITRSHGLPQGIIGKIGVAVSADSNRVYAMIEADDGGLFRSEDAGSSWTRVNEDHRIRQRSFYYTRITADPKDKDTIYMMNTGLYRSTDGGKTMKTLRPQHGDQHDLWIASNDNKRMINSNDGGANVSVDYGDTWTGEGYPTAQLYHVATTTDIPYHVCGAQQDNTTVCVTSAPAGRGGGGAGSTLELGRPVYSPGGGESGYIAPDPKDPDIFYAGSQGALLSRYDRKTGHMRDVQVYPLFFSGMPSSALKERWQWTFPIVFNPIDPKILYTSSQHLWKTTNEGQSWQMISPDLTKADPKTLGDSGGPITKDQNGPEIYATIFTIAPSPKDINTIWTGSDDGMVYITRDGGKNWKDVTPKDLPGLVRISIIDASPNKPGTAYLAAKNYQADDRRPYAYRTDDYGATWTKIINGIPNDDFVHVVREDPKRPGLLFAGTEHGIYVSFDNGAEWQSMRQNLPDTQVPDLLFKDDDLVIATHGRSMYILDDISLLRQLSGQVQSTTLFAPRPAERSLDRGATIDYYLAKEAPVKIDILDAQGKVVRSFEGSAEEEKRQEDRRKAENQDEDGGGRGGARPPTHKAGGNRYVWDLRYPGATTFEGMILWGGNAEQGPMAVPGQYQVRLTADGATQTRPLKIERDPREINITQSDLEEQFKLASQVRDKTSQADEMVIRIRDLKKQIDDRVKAAPPLNAPAERLTTRLSAVEQDVYQVQNRSGQDPLNFPIKINNQLAALLRIIETGDAKPTDQDYVVFKELSARLDELKQRLDQILNADLATFNKAATSAGQQPVK